MEESKIASLASRLADIGEDIKDLVAEKDLIKIQLAAALQNKGVDFVKIELGKEEVLIVKNNHRSSKAFNKDKLATERNIDKDRLDYVGVSEMSVTGQLTAAVVAKYQRINEYEFITVRRSLLKKKED